MKDEIIQSIYANGAQDYEKAMKIYWDVPRKELITSLGFQPGQKILLAAVGTGLDLLPLLEEDVYVTGIDYTQEMLDNAAEKLSLATPEQRKRVELRRMDIHSMNDPLVDGYFQPNTFDGLLSTFTCCVLQNPEKALENIVEVTKPGSRLIFVDYCAALPDTPEVIKLGLPYNEEVRKWQKLIYPYTTTTGFPPGVIVWNSMEDYMFIYKMIQQGLPIKVISDERIESQNPFSTACKIILKNGK